MARPKALSGFPEFLPAQRMVEQRVVDILRRTFELHGFASIQTRAVETMASLNRKGEITKEVYVVRRLHEDNEHETSDSDLGLHFDLTVPLARYVVEHAGHLQFPFRRYQIQPVWRGERPQEGRYREFWQADIDIIGAGDLAWHHDVEAMLVMLEALEALHLEVGIPQVVMHVNNRKLCEGFYQGLGISDSAEVLQRVDKFDKIGADGVGELLREELGLATEVVDKCIALASISTPDDSFVAKVHDLGVTSPLLEEGLNELAGVVRAANQVVPGRIRANLKIARGLDYYTGTVYETELVGHEKMGSVASGGRYEKLASDGKNSYPGVGISLGLTRLLAPILVRGQLVANRQVPSAVLVAVTSEEERSQAMQVATILRHRGIPTEVAPKANKFGKQIRHADRRGIPYVWFGGVDGEVKDIRSGEQQAANAEYWAIPETDIRPSLIHD